MMKRLLIIFSIVAILAFSWDLKTLANEPNGEEDMIWLHSAGEEDMIWLHSDGEEDMIWLHSDGEEDMIWLH
nr:hypothetical protein [Clostridia bacterium]